MKRWTCPECGSTVLLGTRPRKDATKRYCLPCSERNGTLVARVCPTIERDRQKARTLANVKTLKKRAKAKDEWTVSGVDTLLLLASLWKDARKIEPRLNSVVRPDLTLHRSRKHAYTSDRTWAPFKIHITAGTDPEDLRYVLAHEVAHSVARMRHARHAHDDIFKAAEAELLQVSGITKPSWRR